MFFNEFKATIVTDSHFLSMSFKVIESYKTFVRYTNCNWKSKFRIQKEEGETTIPVVQADFVTSGKIAKLTIAAGFESFKISRNSFNEMEAVVMTNTS